MTIKTRKISASFAALAGVALVAACSSGDGGDPTPSDTSAQTGGPSATGGEMTMEAVCEAAKAEGAVDVRRSTDDEVFQKEIEPFQAAYPEIKVNFESMRPGDSVQRIILEDQSGRASVDTVSFDLQFWPALLERDLISDIDWAAYGIDEDWVTEIDGATGFRSQLIFGGLGYNSDLTDPADLPDTWAQIADPKWAGKYIVDPRGTQVAQLALLWGEQQTIDWYKNMVDTAPPQVVEGATAGIQKVISGEAVFSTSVHDAEALEQQAEGAPVEIKWLEAAHTRENYTTVLSNATHPKAGLCFSLWWGSEEGQAQQLKYEFKSNGQDVPDGVEWASITTPDELDMVARTADALAALTQ